MVSASPAGRAPAAPLQAAVSWCRGGLLGVAVFRAVANVLLLAAPVYMLQIYGRVLPSASRATLLALAGVAVFLLSCFGLLNWIWQRLMTRVALTLHDGSKVELFEGSLAENLARLGAPDDTAVLEAARLAHCHPVLMRLPEHYDTAIAEGGANLSAGQRQRVGLARAVYGDPVFVVLDEPDANLDAAGEGALLKTLQTLKQRPATVVLVTHTPRLVRGVDQVLVLQDGVLAEAGPRDAVLQRLVRPAQRRAG